jgi:hypothetical protein
MKKNNTAEKTIRDAEKITKALQEGTEKSLRAIVNETIANLVMEEEDHSEEEEQEDGYSVEDVNTEDVPAVTDNEGGEDNDAEAPEEGAGEEDFSQEGEEGSDEGNADDDEWSDFEQYKVGDNDYDFTGVDGDEILKVYNKLGDDDQIFVKKEDDGTYSVKDDETGAEFVIELDPDALGGEAGSDDTADVDGGEDVDIEGEAGDDDIDINLGGDEDGDIEIDLNDDNEEELNEENLGYTDSYQKDVFDKKFNMNEPADSKTTNDWDEGAPKGSEKPWAGKGDSKPFEKSVNECGAACGNEPANPNLDANLEEDGSGLNTKHANKKSTNHINRGAQNQHQSSEDGEYKALRESVTKIVAKAKAIQAENKQYVECINKIKKSLYEAAVLNVNMGKLVDILVNETTTKDEKKRICERFNAVKTLTEGKNLYETIKSELKESVNSKPAIEKQFVAESKNLNETTIYQNVNDPSIDLMNRMDNLFKK